MNKIPQLEQLYKLLNLPEWQAYMAYKEEELAKCHEELEWQTGNEAIQTQGRIMEIRRDFALRIKITENN